MTNDSVISVSLIVHFTLQLWHVIKCSFILRNSFLMLRLVKTNKNFLKKTELKAGLNSSGNKRLTHKQVPINTCVRHCQKSTYQKSKSYVGQITKIHNVLTITKGWEMTCRIKFQFCCVVLKTVMSIRGSNMSAIQKCSMFCFKTSIWRTKYLRRCKKF